MVVHLAAEPKHLLRLVPVELSLSLGHPALLLALQLLAEGHAERSEVASSTQGETSRHKRCFRPSARRMQVCAVSLSGPVSVGYVCTETCACESRETQLSDLRTTFYLHPKPMSRQRTSRRYPRIFR